MTWVLWFLLTFISTKFFLIEDAWLSSVPSSSLLINWLILFCIYECFDCIYAWEPCAFLLPQRLVEGIRSPGSGSCEPPRGCWESTQGPLQEDWANSTAPILISSSGLTVLLYVIRDYLACRKSADRMASVPVCHQDSSVVFNGGSSFGLQDVCNSSRYPMQYPNNEFPFVSSL